MRIGSGIGVDFKKVVSGVSYPPIIDDGNSKFWYEYEDNIIKDGSDFVSIWGDKTVEGNDLLQAGGSAQPLWDENDGVIFDSIDDFMKTLPFTFNQPEMIYIVFKQISWTIGRKFFDGNGFVSGMVFQNVPSPNFYLNSGVTLGHGFSLTLNTYGILRVLFNSPNSSGQVNNTTKVSGITGLNNMGGFVLGARNTGLDNSNIAVKAVLGRKIVDTAGDDQDIYDYLKNKYI